MNEFVRESLFFGMFVSLLAYEAGLLIKKKWKMAVLNPLLISILLVLSFLLLTGVEYEAYNSSAKYLSYLLTPATVCLAIPLYRELSHLKKNFKAIAAGTVAGVLTSMVSVLLMAYLFGFSHEQYVTLLPKSITTAIGITGILGNVIAELVCKIFRIQEPVAQGLAIGTASHALGTVKAIEMGELEGAISSLAIVVSGLLTVGAASLFANFL